MKKKISLFFISIASLCLLALGLTLKVNAQGESIVRKGVTYNKVTTVNEITNGNYILAYEDNFAGAFNSKYLSRVNDSKLANVYKFVIDDAGYKLKNIDNNLYLQHSSGNTLYEKDLAEASTFNISQDDKGFFILDNGKGYLQYNANKNQERFAVYEKKTQKNLELYKESNAEVQMATIAFNTNGGEEIEPLKAPIGSPCKLPTPTYEGHIFDGWYLDQEFNTLYDETSVITTDITVYAKWLVEVKYTVTFETNGGNPINSLEVLVNSKLSLPSPNKGTYLFYGWYKDQELTEKWDEQNDVVTKDLTLYAKWSEKDHIIIQNLNDFITGKYILSGSEALVGVYNGKEFEGTINPEDATVFTLYKIGNHYLISFIYNDEEVFIVNSTKEIKVGTIEEAYLSKITLNDPEFYSIDLSIGIDSKGTEYYLHYNKQTNKFKAYKTTSNQKAIAAARVSDSEFDSVDKLIKDETTKASLKFKYNSSTFTPTDVDLRFGTILPKYLYNSEAKYGVIAARSTSNYEFKTGLQVEASAQEFLEKFKEAKNIEATPAEVENGYQFAWVINNIEDQNLVYNEEFIAVAYIEINGHLYFVNPTSYSASSLANYYIENSEALNLSEEILKVLKNIK